MGWYWWLLTFLFPVLVSCSVNQTPTAQNAAATAAKAEPAVPRRIEILFLGDNRHHQPIERVPSLMAALGPKGINFTYTDRLEDLNPANLNQYDGLLIYATTTRSAPPRRRRCWITWPRAKG